MLKCLLFPGKGNGRVVVRIVTIRGDIHPNTSHLPLVKVRFQSFTRQMSTHTHTCDHGQSQVPLNNSPFLPRPSGLVYNKQNVSRQCKSEDTCNKINWLEQ